VRGEGEKAVETVATHAYRMRGLGDGVRGDVPGRHAVAPSWWGQDARPSFAPRRAAEASAVPLGRVRRRWKWRQPTRVEVSKARVGEWSQG
jgi:hypothetical protein